MEAPLISIIVPTYNRCEMLRDALESLCRQETGGQFSYEIVVVDNASTDDTRATVEDVAAQAPVPVRYLYHEIPGDASTRNRGIGSGQWLAFFDDDQLAAPDWLAKLYEAAQETGALAVGGAVQLYLDQHILDGLGPYVRRTSFRETNYGTAIRRFRGKTIPGCANALVARQVFDTVGMFDTAMVWGGSDSDFFIRTKAAGMDLYFTPHAVIRHRIPLNRLTPEYFRWDAQQGCDALACHDHKFKGPTALVLCCLARIIHGVFVLLPGLAWARLTNNRSEVLDYQVRLWRIPGYFRRTLALLAPHWFPQHSYFTHLKFRKGRTIGQQATPVEAAL